ncbi:MAG: calcium-binding protein [Subtercola sp.]|nr:calcium-binding protein [Subtercola sp.]
MKITTVPGVRTVVGEGPVWDAQRQLLYFVDLLGDRVGRFDPSSGDVHTWPTPVHAAAVSPSQGVELVLTLADGFHRLDVVTGAISSLARVDLPPGAILSDAKVDRSGRLVAVSSDESFVRPIGNLHSLENGVVRTTDTGHTIGNGPCWSKNGRTFYVSDSVKSTIYAYECAPETGVLGSRRVFATTTELGGMPDGATVDADDHVWVVIHGAGVIARFAPDGSLQATVTMPTKHITSLTIGGPNFDTLYVTSLQPAAIRARVADGGPDESGAEVDGDSDGRLFVVTGLGVRGVPEPVVRLSID